MNKKEWTKVVADLVGHSDHFGDRYGKDRPRPARYL